MLTSSVPGEGKTLQSIALAHNLAGLDKKVLLIEGDIRRRTFGVYFPAAKEAGGFLSVISGRLPLQGAIFRANDLGIDVLMVRSYCQIWCLRAVGHAAIWSSLVSIPSLNLTPVMTLAR